MLKKDKKVDMRYNEGFAYSSTCGSRGKFMMDTMEFQDSTCKTYVEGKDGKMTLIEMKQTTLKGNTKLDAKWKRPLGKKRFNNKIK